MLKVNSNRQVTSFLAHNGIMQIKFFSALAVGSTTRLAGALVLTLTKNIPPVSSN